MESSGCLEPEVNGGNQFTVENLEGIEKQREVNYLAIYKFV